MPTKSTSIDLYCPKSYMLSSLNLSGLLYMLLFFFLYLLLLHKGYHSLMSHFKNIIFKPFKINKIRTTSIPVISWSVDSSSFGDDNLESCLVSPWIAAPMLAAAIIEGGYMENLTSEKRERNVLKKLYIFFLRNRKTTEYLHTTLCVISFRELRDFFSKVRESVLNLLNLDNQYLSSN